MKDFITELQSNPRFLYIAGIIIVVIIVITSILMLDFDSAKKKPTMEQQAALLPTDTLPDDFFEPIQKPIPQKKVVKKQPKKIPTRTVNVQDLVKTIKKQKPELSSDEELRLELLKERSRKGSVVVAYRDKSDADFVLKDRSVDVSKDDDFSAHDLSKSIPTYEVDLSRTLTADRFIPAVLYTEIKSELPSKKVIAVVEQNVFAAHGRKILIPRGSKAIGQYEPLDQQGDARLGVNWYRIITPKGINIKLQSELSDGEGASGITGDVDNRSLDKYGTAFLFSSLAAMAQLSVDTENESTAAAADAFTSEFGQVTAESLRNSFDIVPRVRIPKGARINISPLTDIWFKPPLRNTAQVIPVDQLKMGGEYSATIFQQVRPQHFQFDPTRPVKLTQQDLKYNKMDIMKVRNDSLPDNKDYHLESISSDKSDEDFFNSLSSNKDILRENFIK